jgi:phosphate uptake regulator
MQEAYDCADRDELEAYNSVKVMCGEVLDMVEELIKAEREACVQIVEALKEIVDAADGAGWNQLDATFTRARAALKKARGER